MIDPPDPGEAARPPRVTVPCRRRRRARRRRRRRRAIRPSCGTRRYPFITGNPAATVKATDLKPTHIAVSHGHADHLGDTVELAKRTGATVFCNFELGEHIMAQGVKAVEQFNPGGQVKTTFGFIACTKAFHSSSIEPSGKYAGQPNGIIAHFKPGIGGDATPFTAYHCGDTDLFGDMALVGEIYKPDVAFIPIGDRYTMGPMLATARRAHQAQSRRPHPLRRRPPIADDPADFNPRGVQVPVMKPGESWPVE